MKMFPISTTSFNWPLFIKEIPSSLTSELNLAGINLQSPEGFVRLMSAYESFADNMTSKIVCDYILNHWSLGLYFEMPYYWIEDFRKTDLHILAIPKGRDDNVGIVTGTIKEWKQTYFTCRLKCQHSDFFNRLKQVIETLFESNKLKFLLEANNGS